jgi:hypothetical protein
MKQASNRECDYNSVAHTFLALCKVMQVDFVYLRISVVCMLWYPSGMTVTCKTIVLNADCPVSLSAE